MAMTRSLAVEWGHAGIRLNAIAPGPIPTEGAFSRLMANPAAEKAALERIPSAASDEARGDREPRDVPSLGSLPLPDRRLVTMDGGEWIAGAGEFSDYRKVPRETLAAAFDAMRPKKG